MGDLTMLSSTSGRMRNSNHVTRRVIYNSSNWYTSLSGMLEHMSLSDLRNAGHMIREPQPSGPSLAGGSQQKKRIAPMTVPGEAPPTGLFHILIGRKKLIYIQVNIY